MRSYRVLSLFLAFALALGACNLPTANATPTVNANAIFTAAAQTVEVKLTENAATNPTATVPPPTDTPAAATDTPLPPPPVIVTATSAPVIVPTTACDAAMFVSDVTIPDGTGFTGGATFTKTWRLKNAGTCTWNSSYALSFDSGDQMGGPTSQPISGTVAPGQTVDISINLQAPNNDGTYTGIYGLKNPSGVRFPVIGGISGRSFSVVIKVGSGVSGGTAGPTSVSGDPTDVPVSVKLAVIGFYYNNVTKSGSCGTSNQQYSITANMTINRAGNVTYHWVRSDGGVDPTNTLSFDHAGTKSVTYTWNTSVTSGLWVSLYVDNPNHQQFPQVSLSCP